MHPSNSLFKVFCVSVVLATLVASSPQNISGKPINLGNITGDVIQVAGKIWYTVSHLNINLDWFEFKKDDSSRKFLNQPNLSFQESKFTIPPDKDTEIKSPSGKITLKIPAGAVTEKTDIEFIEYSCEESTGMVMLNRFDLNAKGNISGKTITKFNKNLEITFTHEPEELDGLDIDTLRLYYLDEKTKQWLPITTSKYDSNQKTVKATTNHFTHFGEQVSPLTAGPGRIMSTEVNLQAGSSTFNYPIELPPGPGGFQPKLALNYNSASVDEMKNKQAVGSWVGIGWSLKFGSITYDKTSGRFYLDLNGISYELISSTDGTCFYTNPESNLKIIRGSGWEVWDKDGNYYQFGGTTDSSQYNDWEFSEDYSGYPVDYYRWDLNLMRDVNNNQATISYGQYMMPVSPGPCCSGLRVRAAYPSQMNYGNVTVLFNYATDDGNLRRDDPVDYGSNLAPRIMDVAYLNNVQIKVSNNLIRQYNFSYQWQNRVLSTDYGGIYYAGQMMLASVQQVGTSGGLLPAMQFTYQNKEVYRHSAIDEYVGNPGNPAVLSWPFLTRVESGYGGEIDITYTQKPVDTTLNLWTRQAVTAKSTNSGIGPLETYNYDYSNGTNDYPEYGGESWDQDFLGFDQVKETDSANNYTKHWFYTNGTVDGKEAFFLQGKEYKTQWFDSSGRLLKEKTYDWSAVFTPNSTALDYRVVFDVGTSNNGYVAASNDGYVYITDNCNNKVKKYDQWGHFILDWGGLTGLQGVAVDSGGNVYVTENINLYHSQIQKFSSTGTLLQTIDLYGESDYGVNIYLKDLAVNSSGNIYVIYYNGVYGPAIEIFNPAGVNIGGIGCGYWTPQQTIDYCIPKNITIANGDIYVVDGSYGKVPSIFKCTNGLSSWGTYGGPGIDGQIYGPRAITGTADSIYVFDSPESNMIPTRVQKFSLPGNQFVEKYSIPEYLLYPYANSFNPCNDVLDACITSDGRILMMLKYGFWGNNQIVEKLLPNWAVQLAGVQEKTFKPDDVNTYKTTKTQYEYDVYGNIVKEKVWGDTGITTDNSITTRTYYPNTTANILDKPAQEKVYTATDDTFTINESNLKKQTNCYYDGNNTSLTTPPTKGNMTRVQQWKDASNSVSTYSTYDSYGNMLTSTDANGNVTSTTWDTTYHTYPATKTYPVSGLSESYTFDPGTNNLLTSVDVNGNTTTYQYDEFKRLLKVIKPGDSSGSPSITYQYNNWGTLNSQNVKTITKIDGSNSIWSADYFDGLGRVVQTQAQSETTGHTMITGTTAFNNRGQVDKQYVSQDIASVLSAYYNTGIGSWKYSNPVYDALGRVITQTAADGTTVSNDYTNVWQMLATNELGYKTRYYYDAFQRLTKVEELNTSQQVYATTNYTYDTIGNLTQVVDNNSNTTAMTYDRLARKTGMTDPDMGAWSYQYDGNGNLTSQTDAKSQTITMAYDAMNRLTNKNYPSGSGMTNVVYSYDSTSGGNYGKGLRTGMVDAISDTSHPSTYKYDNRGRLIQEVRTEYSNSTWNSYTTTDTYDGLDRAVTVTYPTGETVTNTYNARGLPNTVTDSIPIPGSPPTVVNLVTGTTYNQLASITQINLGNGLKTNYSYWGIDHGTTAYGKLWEIKTQPQAGGTALQDMQYTWDAIGNLTQRQNLVASETENFTYDSLDRLTAVSGAYTQSYAYNAIGNITAMNGTNYTYTDNSHKHAVTAVGTTNYQYDANGNMTTRGTQTIGWDVENRVVAVSGAASASFVYDGDGNRVKKTEGGQTIVYINQYYEKNLTTGVVTTSYYLGGQLIAQRAGTTLTYIHQDSLGSTSLMTDTNGAQSGATLKYLPFGLSRNTQQELDSVATAKKFTGQRLDDTGLYYYNARYYDASIGRFISADTVVQSLYNPQTLNRYSYCVNNPLTYTDPSGNIVNFQNEDLSMQYLTWAMDYGCELDQGTWAMIQDWAALRNAWYELGTVAPELTQKLINDPQTVIVQWSDKIAGGQTTRDRFTGNYNILLGNDNQKCSTELLAALMSHEAFHVAEYFATGASVDHNTAANEAFAYSFGYQVASKLGVASDYAGLIPSAFSEFFDIDPYMDKKTLEGKINQARYTLFNEPGSNYYRVIFSMVPYTKWPGIFGTGRSKFLTVAQSVWIH